MCSLEFDEEKAAKSCASCFVVSTCGLIKCPRCGYETPPVPKMPEWIKGLCGFFGARA